MMEIALLVDKHHLSIGCFKQQKDTIVMKQEGHLNGR